MSRASSAKIFALSSLLVAIPATAEEPAFGYSLEPRWDELVLRVVDRTGRPDRRGPILQSMFGDTYPEYRLDLAVAEFPMARELRWARDPEGARLWVQSVDEFTLATRATIEKHVPHAVGYFGFRYDAFQTRARDTRLLRLDFAFEDVLVDGLDAQIRAYPRWEKDDSDVEVRVAYEIPELAATRLRIVALDTFTNASAALARSRGGSLVYDQQRDLPLLVLGEVSTFRLHGARAELYVGTMLPQSTLFRNDLAPESTHLRTESARLTGGLLEYTLDDVVAAGATALVVDTSFERADPDTGSVTTVQTEQHSELTAYALAHPHRRVELEAFIRRTGRPTTLGAVRRSDIEWMSAARVIWMLGSVGGVDLAVYRLVRDAEAERATAVDGTNHRFVTRAVLRFDPAIWVSFGVGWDLDPRGGSVYDGAGLTMTADF